MEYEELVKIDEEINSLDDDNYYNNLEFKINNIFSDFNQKEIKKLALFNDRINQYILFLEKGSEIYFPNKIKQRIEKIKNKIYNQVEELIKYKNNLKLLNNSYIDLKKYVHALDLVVSTIENNEDNNNQDNENNENNIKNKDISLTELKKYFRNIIVINEIKKGIDETVKLCSKYDYKPSQKIVEYSNMLNKFIEKKINQYSEELDYLNQKIKKYKPNSTKEKIYKEEFNMALKDCMDLLKK
jgi:hypothetical protein